MSNELKIWNFLKDKGLNDFAIAGIMGNIYAESLLAPNNLQNSYSVSLGYSDEEYTKAVDDGSYDNFVRDSAGYGLVQWTHWSRKEGLLKFAKETGRSIGDLDMQLEYFWKEISGYKGVMNTLRNAKSVHEASVAVHLEYERPADQSETAQKRRASYGQKYYDKYASKEVADTKDDSASTTGDQVYIVKAGDTLSKIAKEFKTTYQKIAKHNGISNPNKISVGQTIKIPSDDKAAVHTVVKGDTLSAIAKRFGTTAKKLAEHNKITDPNKIYIGQIIRIPK